MMGLKYFLIFLCYTIFLTQCMKINIKDLAERVTKANRGMRLDQLKGGYDSEGVYHPVAIRVKIKFDKRGGAKASVIHGDPPPPDDYYDYDYYYPDGEEYDEEEEE